MALLTDGSVPVDLLAAPVAAALVASLTVLFFFFVAARTRGLKGGLLPVLFSLERWPFAVLCGLSALLAALPPELTADGAIFGKIVVVAVISAVVWALLRLIGIAQEIVFAHFPVDKADNLYERKVRTRFQYIRYILTALIIFVGIAVIFLQFEALSTIGTGLLASAGVAGIVIALAAHQTLGNLLAGFQIAFAQPFRIDDVVIVEGEWGRIEEITFTYVVVRIWDQRRLVLPVSYFITTPFQNWTRTSAEILGTVFIHADYSVPVDEVRDELGRIVRSSPLWDGRVCGLQVTDASERTMTLRALVSAKDASDAWDLRCIVRERLIAFMQERHPGSLPRLRVDDK